MNIFNKLSNLLGGFLYGEIESRLQTIIDEIERDKIKTEKLQAELIRSRMEKEAYKNLIITIGETIPDMMWAKDIEGRYLYANPMILEGLFYGMSHKVIIGKTDLEITKMCKDLVGDENHTFGEICANSDEVVLKSLKKGRFLEWGLIDGKDLYLEVYKAPLIDKDGKLVGTVGTGRDISEWYTGIRSAILGDENCINCNKDWVQGMLIELDKYKFEG